MRANTYACNYIYVLQRGEESHDKGVSVSAPVGEFIEGFWDVDFSLSWVGDRCSPEDLCSCSPVAVLRAVIVLSSGCPPCRARVRGLAGQTLLSGIQCRFQS